MKISGKVIAESILKKLQLKIKKENLKPILAIILAGENPASMLYVNSKLKTAQKLGIGAQLFQFKRNEKNKLLKTLDKLNKDKKIHGIIVQFPLYDGWNFDEIVSKMNPQKDVDGFLQHSSFKGATALAVWEMLGAFARHEGFKNTEDFLKGKKVVILGKGKTAGSPTIELLREKLVPSGSEGGIALSVIDSKTENPDEIIKKADVVISATGRKNIINGSNIKRGAYVIGVGVGKEIIDGLPKIYGDINEEQVSKKAKLYCPTIGGIGPLTIASLLRNVVQSAHGTDG